MRGLSGRGISHECVSDAVLHPSAPIEENDEPRIPVDARTAALLVLVVVVVPFAL
jgi:hypothetical protein